MGLKWLETIPHTAAPNLLLWWWWWLYAAHVGRFSCVHMLPPCRSSHCLPVFPTGVSITPGHCCWAQGTFSCVFFCVCMCVCLHIHTVVLCVITIPPTRIMHVCIAQLYVWDYGASAKHPPVAIYKAPRSLRAVRFHPTGAPLLLTAELMDPTPVGLLPTAATHAEHVSVGLAAGDAGHAATHRRRLSAFSAASRAGGGAAAASHATPLQPSTPHEDMPRVPSTHGFALPGDDVSPSGAHLARATSSGSLLATLQEDLEESLPRVASRSLLSVGITQDHSTRGSADSDRVLLADASDRASMGSGAQALMASQSMDEDVFCLAELGSAVEPCRGDVSPQSPEGARGLMPSNEGSSETSPQQQPQDGGSREDASSLVRSAPLPIRTSSLMTRWLTGAFLCGGRGQMCLPCECLTSKQHHPFTVLSIARHAVGSSPRPSRPRRPPRPPW